MDQQMYVVIVFKGHYFLAFGIPDDIYQGLWMLLTFVSFGFVNFHTRGLSP
jgi:hypothetical protein